MLDLYEDLHSERYPASQAKPKKVNKSKHFYNRHTFFFLTISAPISAYATALISNGSNCGRRMSATVTKMQH